MLNLFGYRATDPRELRRVHNPVGAKNDATLLCYRAEFGTFLAAWGNDGKLLGRAAQVVSLIGPDQLRCLRMTAKGQPVHPLYQPGHLTPQPFLGGKG